MAKYEFGSDEFHKAAWEAGHQAYLETLAAGLPVACLDSEGRNVLEYPDGPKVRDPLDPGRTCRSELRDHPRTERSGRLKTACPFSH
jgi:hypothetical protein